MKSMGEVMNVEGTAFEPRVAERSPRSCHLNKLLFRVLDPKPTILEIALA
jgi:hypothetical protein